MKTVYGIMIQDQDRHTKHVQELYTCIDKARERRDTELKALLENKRLVSSPILDLSHPMIAKLICGMFGSNLFSARIIKFLVPTDYQTCAAIATT